MTQMTAVGDAFWPRRVAEHCEHRIVIGARTPPSQNAVRGGDHHTVDPRPLGPWRREPDRLEPFRVGRALAERKAHLSVRMPMDLRRRAPWRHYAACWDQGCDRRVDAAMPASSCARATHARVS